MRNRYLVCNPMGMPLVRCNTLTEVHKFIRYHVAKTSEAYLFLTGEILDFAKYSVTDLEDITICKDLDLTST